MYTMYTDKQAMAFYCQTIVVIAITVYAVIATEENNNKRNVLILLGKMIINTGYPHNLHLQNEVM